MLNQTMTLYISQYGNLPGVAGMAYCTGVHPRRLAARLIMWDAESQIHQYDCTWKSSGGKSVMASRGAENEWVK
jgi:hypothetical protein